MGRRLKLVAALAAALGLVAAAGWWWVVSNHQRLEAWALGRLKAMAAARGLELAWTRARLWPPGQAELGGVVVRDAGGVVLAAGRIRLLYSPLALAGGRLRVRSCLVEALRFSPRVMALMRGDGGGLALSLEEIRISGAELIGSWGAVEQFKGAHLAGRLSVDVRGVRGTLELARAEAVVGGRRWRLSAQAVFEGSVVLVPRLEAHGPGGRVLGSARIGPGQTLTARARFVELELGRIGRISGRVRVWGGLGKVEFRLRAGSQRISRLEATGRVWPAGQRLELEARAGKVDLEGVKAAGAWVRVAGSWGRGGQMSLTGGAQRVAFRGVEAGIRRLKAVGGWPGWVEVRELECEGPWGKLEASGRWRPWQRPWEEPVRADVALVLRRLPPALARALPSWAEGLEGRMRIRLKAGTWQLRGHGLRAGPVGLEQLEASGRVGPGWHLVVDKAVGRGTWGEVEAGGSLDPGGCRLRGLVRSPGGERLVEVLRGLKLKGITASGPVQLNWTLAGEWGGLAAVVEGRGRGLEGWGRVAGRWKLWGRVGPGSSWEGRVSLEQCRGMGPGVRGVSVVGSGQGASWEAGVQFQGRVAGGLRARGEGSRAWVESGWVRWGAKRWRQQGQMRVEWGRGRVRIEGLELLEADGRGRVWGEFALGPAEAIAGRLRAQGVALEGLGMQLRGRVKELECLLEGTLARPRVRLGGELEAMAWRGVKLGDVRWKGEYAGAKAVVEGRILPPGGGSARVRASVPLRVCLAPASCALARGALEAKVELEGLDMRVVGAVAGLGQGPIRARASGVVEVSGEPGEPLVTGRLRITGTAQLPATGQQFRELRLEALFSGRKVSFTGRARAGGLLTLAGSVMLPGRDRPAQVELELRARGVEVELGPEGVVSVDGRLGVRGRPEALVLTGRLKATGGRLSPGMITMGSQQEVVVLRPGQRPPPLVDSSLSRALPEWVMGAMADVRVGLAEGFRLKVGEGWVGLEGGLRLAKARGDLPGITGRLKATGGVIILKGRRFVLQRGQIIFNGSWPPRPSIWAEAMVDLGRVKVTVTAVGPLAQPRLQFSSDPPMPTQDVLSALIFGRPARGLSEAQSRELSAQALVLLGQEGAQQLTRMFGPQIAPEVVTIYESSQGTEAVEAGKYLGKRLYIRYRRSLGPSPGQSVGLEYNLSEHVVIESQLGTTRDSGVDLLFTYEFD